MNGSTDEKPQKITASWQFKFFAASIVLLMLALAKAFGVATSLEPFFNPLMHPKTALAPIIAGGVTVASGIAEFSGKTPETLEADKYVSVFFSLFVIFVPLPVIYITVRKKIHSGAFTGKTKRTILRALSILFAVNCMAMISMVSSAYLVSRPVLNRMQNDHGVNRYREDVIAQMAEIAYKAQQYYILPAQLGGGGQQFGKNGKSLTIGDLGFPKRSSLGRFILYRGDSDTTLHAVFYGNKNIYDRSAKNETPSPLIEYEMTIYPSSHRIIRVQ